MTLGRLDRRFSFSSLFKRENGGWLLLILYGLSMSGLWTNSQEISWRHGLWVGCFIAVGSGWALRD